MNAQPCYFVAVKADPETRDDHFAKRSDRLGKKTIGKNELPPISYKLIEGEFFKYSFWNEQKTLKTSIQYSKTSPSEGRLLLMMGFLIATSKTGVPSRK